MREVLTKNPIIAAIKDKDSLDAVCKTEVKFVFLLFGSISDLQGHVQQLKNYDKRVFVHLDLIEGLKADREGLRFIAEHIKPFGIITTKPAQIKLAQHYGLKGVLRIFMIDAAAYQTGLKGIEISKPFMVEIMPGLLPDIIHSLTKETDIMIVSGGMIKTKEQVATALQNGAVAISTSNPSLWDEIKNSS